MSAVKAGAGREEAHAILKDHAVGAALEIREGSSGNNDLIDRIAEDPNLPIDRDTINEILGDHNNHWLSASSSSVLCECCSHR